MKMSKQWALRLVCLAAVGGASAAWSAPLSATPPAAAPAAAVAPHAAGQARRFAIVVGENTPQSDTLAALKYADDDAIRHAELLSALGVKVWVLTVPDAETQGLHPRIAGLAGSPTLSRLREVLAQVFREIVQARAEGASTDFFFVFAGHGEVGPNREGRLHLRDGFLSRKQLLDEVVATNPADFKHLVLDACHAEALVYRRGEGESPPDFSDLIAGDLARADLTHYADTGILLASTRDERTHEWAVFRAGVFSHELRSGLAGAADVNRDGVIEYSELAAFVASANAGLQHTTARATVVSRPPPLDRHRALADVGSAARNVLELPATLRGRLWIESESGERYVDVHPSGEAPLLLAMAAPQEGGRFYLRRGEQEADLPVTTPGRFRVAHIDWRPARQAARGSVEDALRRNLFTVPFGPSFYDGWVASTDGLRAVMQREDGPMTVSELVPVTRARAEPLPGLQVAAEPATSSNARWLVPGGLGLAALAAGGTALGLGLSAQSDADTYRATVRRTGLDDAGARSSIARQQDWSNGLYIGAGVLAAAAVGSLFVNWGGPDIGAAPTQGGAAAAASWRW